jgi:BolA protein
VIAATEIVALIRKALPGAEVKAIDLTGGQDHWKVQVVSERFQGLGLLERHRLVNGALAEPLKGPLHALQIECSTPSELAG